MNLADFLLTLKKSAKLTAVSAAKTCNTVTEPAEMQSHTEGNQGVYVCSVQSSFKPYFALRARPMCDVVFLERLARACQLRRSTYIRVCPRW